jgi:hypothetical protein
MFIYIYSLWLDVLKTKTRLLAGKECNRINFKERLYSLLVPHIPGTTCLIFPNER